MIDLHRVLDHHRSGGRSDGVDVRRLKRGWFRVVGDAMREHQGMDSRRANHPGTSVRL